MATLGTELGYDRYLASTVVTGSGQRSSTFLAELCLSTVLVLALRAFHCRPRRKKRASFTARVMSSIVDAPRARRERPRGCTAEQRDEASASESRLSEMLTPSAFAVLRLITNSNLVTCCTGRSAGFVPLRMRTTKSPACRYAPVSL